MTGGGVFTTDTTYDNARNRTRVKDQRGNFTVTQADSLGRVVWIHRGACDASGTPSATCETVERNEYDGSGNKVLSADGRERKTRFEYDGASRLVAREEGYEAALPADTTLMRFELDSGGRVTKEFRGRLAATEPAMSYAYDKVNRVVSEKNGGGEETVYGYDAEGNRTSVKPPGRPVTAFAYDELGKLTSVTMPPTEDYATAAVTRFAYDSNRNKTSQKDARNNETTYQYDAANRLTRQSQPGNLETAYGYDNNGNAVSMRDANGQMETSTFDELNRKRTTTYAENPSAPSTAWREVRSARFEYDGNSNETEMHRMVSSGTDPPQDRSIVRTFDALDRHLTETTTLPDGGTKQVGYEYFANGTRKAVIDPNGRRTAYEYDAQNRVSTMTTDAGASVTTYKYFPDDLVKEVAEPNGVKATSTYDKAGRLLTLTNAGVSTTLSSYVYEYDPQGTGNRTKQIETNNSAPGGVQSPETTLYTYDASNRLKSVTYPQDATYPAGRVVTYTYDKAGNREGEKETTTSGAVIVERAGMFDANNRLTLLNTTPGPSVNLLIAYDNNGNETSRLSTTYANDAQGNPVPPTVVVTQSTYDLTDHLVEQKRGLDIITRHEYDAEGRRTKKIGEEGIRQYVYDDTSLLAEYDTNGLEIAKYDYGGDRLIRLARADEGTRYFSFDGLGSVTGLTDATGAVAAAYHLDAWGNYRFTSELAPSKNRFGFTGHYWDNEAGLYYAKARFYDPFTARFTQADSFMGSIDDPPSLHRYQYANDNPTMFVDPSGHFTWKAAWEVIKGIPRALAEPALQVYDTALVSGVSAMGIPSDFINLQSGLGRRQQGRIEEQQSGGISAIKGAAENTAATFTFGATAMVQGYAEAGMDFSQGRIGVDQLDDRLTGLGVGLSVIAGGAKIAAGSRGGVAALEVTEGRSGVATGVKGPAHVAADLPNMTAPITNPSRLLTVGNPTTRTLAQVRALRGEARWKAGESYARELYGAGPERHFPVQAADGSHPVTGTGGRFVDAPVDLPHGGGVLAGEVKTYQQWKTVDGSPHRSSVPLNDPIQQQINKDVRLRRHVPGYDPRFLFLDAGPSAELAAELARNRIVGVQYK